MSLLGFFFLLCPSLFANLQGLNEIKEKPKLFKKKFGEQKENWGGREKLPVSSSITQAGHQG